MSPSNKMQHIMLLFSENNIGDIFLVVYGFYCDLKKVTNIVQTTKITASCSLKQSIDASGRMFSLALSQSD